ncbi:MAG TPA: hypothetical protein VGQ83_41580 [Polyangia bacterium]|jgi:predicted CxxxxCH...CXXCH cytochrome family protein
MTSGTSRKARGGAIGAALLGISLLGGCLTQKAGTSTAEEDCTPCHGEAGSFPNDNLRSAAPPQAVHIGYGPGQTSTMDNGVGAHRTHLGPSTLTKPLDCEECHVVPRVRGQLTADAPGHMDGRGGVTPDGRRHALLTFGGRATMDEVAAAYDLTGRTCVTYCHGTTLSGGTLTVPVWTDVGSGQAACGTCHGLPPAAPHPQSTQCHLCHPSAGPGLTIKDPARHINGTVDLIDGGNCSACHGSAANPAPPVDTQGRSDTALRSVGAHQAHVTEGALARAFECGACHPTPDPAQPLAHVDGVVDLAFGDLARTDATTATFDGARCANYCHGATLTGGALTTPGWTTVDGSQAACGTCHGLPPAAPHPQSQRCHLCHPTVDQDHAIVRKDLHVDGKVDVIQDPSCSSCHGSAQNPAPPTDTSGRADPALPSVGAHQAHVNPDPATSISAPVACGECHVVPDAARPFEHINDAVEVTFGGLATANGVPAAWSGTTCQSYCHGATLSAGTNTTPAWTTVDGSQAACGTCHGLPPAPPHPQSGKCGGCHAKVIDLDGNFVDKTLHINGRVDLDMVGPGGPCTSCHGSTQNPAPPVDTHGRTATTLRSVGAHQAHLNPDPAQSISAPIACAECHVVPTSSNVDAHIDGTAEVVFGPLANARGASSAWSGTTCTTYCHGQTLAGGALTTPAWTTVDNSQDACGTCHGLPPDAPHPANDACYACHGAVIDASRNFVDKTLHINGRIDVSTTGACDGCHEAPPATGAHQAHYGSAASTAAYGDLRRTSDFASGPTPSATYGCGTCHPIDPAKHMNGTVEVELANAAAPAGSLKALSPAATYSPGATTLTDARGYHYTLGTCQNVYCHSGPTFGAPTVPLPGVDFTFDGSYPIVYPSYTVTAGRVYGAPAWGGTVSTCDACHGYPPRTSAPGNVAGAGDSHSWIDADGYENLHNLNMSYDPLQCRTCHYATVTGAATFTRDAKDVTTWGAQAIADARYHANGVRDVRFDLADPVSYATSGGPVTYDLGTAAWNPTAKTCTNVGCHQQETVATWGAPYRWANYPECDRCHRY